MFKGSITALITPLKNGKVDEKAFQDFVEWQINQGAHGLVPCGTTGESPTLTHEEHERVIDLCIEAANGKVPVIAGTGSNSTDEAISLTKFSKEIGADAALVVTPYYNKPTQEGLYQHFKAINDSCDLPIIIYNIPGRSVVDINNCLDKLDNETDIVVTMTETSRSPFFNMVREDNEYIKLLIDDNEYIEFSRLMINSDVERFITGIKSKYSLVTIAPPYADDCWKSIMPVVEKGRFIDNDSVIFAEHGRQNKPDSNYGSLIRTSARQYGDSYLSIYSMGVTNG